MSPARRLGGTDADAHTATRKLVRTSGERGQSTVELVLVLPVVVMAMLAVVQIGLVAHQYLVV
ncbi:MAG: pilus assembly protein, partial [Acidimicrobiia bacterium]|nr:pilus assembly protein [Acidimicrobiia bacterium]